MIGSSKLPRSTRAVCGVLAAIGCLCAPVRAEAQAVYGSVSGTVTDNSGAVLPGATVTITSLERQTVDTVVANDSGSYTKDRLVPGDYEVKAELAGFKSAIVPRVKVSVDTQTPVSFKLEVGAITESVQVTGGSPLLKTDRADVSTTFDARQMTELPVLDRNLTKFVLLTPGTQQLGWQHAASENPQGSTQIMVNGQHFSGTAYQLDGTENRDPILGIIVINSTLESVAETKITSQNYDAEFGQATAGVVSVRTKSGTNELHGSAFEFYRGARFQARNPFTQFQRDPLTGRFIPETSHHQFGASLGGPIKTNRFFFFGDYQGTRDKQGGSRLLTVPTEAARRGDLSAYGVNIFDPTTGATPADRAQFSGNQIPQGRLSAQALNILGLIPTPNAPGRDNGTRDNYVASGSETFDENSLNGRVDGRLSENLNIFGRYSTGGFARNGPTAFGTGGGAALGSLGGVSEVRNHSIAIGVDRTFSPTLLADFRFGFFQYKVNVLPFDFGSTPAQDAGIPGLNLDQTFTSGLPAFFINGNQADMNFGSGLGVNQCNCPLDQNEKQWQMVGNLTKLAGNHSFKFGADVRRAYNLRVPSDVHRSGELRFNADRTRGPSGGGLGLATFLLGDVTEFGRFVSPSTDARELQWRHFYYAQDTWKASNKLTLNYGVRLDVINPQTVNEAGNGGWLDLTTGQILVGGVGDVNLAGNVENSYNWAPRLGVSYQLNEKTVLRAGYGRSYDIGVFGSLFGHSVTQNLPVLSAQSVTAPNNFDRVFTLAQGPPSPTFPDPGSSGRFPLPGGVFTRAMPQKQRLPAVDAFNVTVQHQLSPTVSIEAGYVGNRGHGVFAGDGPTVNPNQPSIVGFGTLNTNQRRPFFNGLVRTDIEDLGGNFGWTQNIDYFCNCADNWYDSLQARFTKRFSGGLQANASYTLQRAEQEDGDYFFHDRTLNKGVTGWNRTHALGFQVVALIPIGRDQKFMSDIGPGLDAVIGGWQLNTNTSIQSGLPFDVGYRDSGADRDTGPGRVNVIGDPKGPETQAQWFNVTPIGSPGSAFSRPAVGTFGDMERNSLRGPGYWRVDASLFKNIPLGGSKSIQIRIESVNVLNHVNLGNPDSQVGVPGNNNPNAGRITGIAAGDQQRNLQFALKFAF